MPAPAPDPGISSIAAQRPCGTRRWVLQQDNTVAAAHGWFPWKGQNIDTPWRASGTKWTSDDDSHPLT